MIRYMGLFLLLIINITPCIRGGTHWIRQGVGTPIAASLAEDVLLLSTNKEVVASLDAFTGSIKWRYAPYSSKARIIAFQWLSVRLTVVFVNDETSVLAHLLDNQTGQLLSYLVLCDHSKGNDCTSCTGDNLQVREFRNSKVVFNLCHGKRFLHDISNGTTTSITSESPFAKVDRVQKLSKCPFQSDEAFVRCFRFEDYVLRVELNGRTQLTNSSGQNFMWTRVDGTSHWTKYLPFPKQQILVVLSKNVVFGLSLKDGSLRWSTDIPSRYAGEILWRILQVNSGHFAILGTVSDPYRGARTALTTFEAATGEIIRTDDFSVNVTQAAKIVMDSEEEVFIALLSTTGETKIHAMHSLNSSKSNIKAHNVHWVRKLGPCVVGGFIAGTEQWVVKVPKCTDIVSITMADVLSGQSLSARKIVAQSSGELLHKRQGDNLVALVARDSASQIIMVLDGITGAILESLRHKGVDDNVSIVLSQNWMAHTIWNVKYMVQELHITEFHQLYDHNAQLKTARSSRQFMQDKNKTMPRVLRASYAISSRIETLTITNTKRGITEKALVFGLQSGQIVMVPKIYLEPNKVMTGVGSGSATPKYHPALSLEPEGGEIHVTRKLSISNLDGVIGCPSLTRESLVHIIALGLDIYHSIVAPSGSFDALSEGFNKMGVVLTTSILFISTVIARTCALRSQITQEWS